MLSALLSNFAPLTAPAGPASTERATLVTLRDRQLWVADALRMPLRIRCLSGSVWITREGCPGDVVIGADETYVVSGAGKVIVQALDRAVVLIDR